ncbi:cyclic di-AMP binding protein CbpA [Allofustis seminis]|uniref:cyclic di-AMP binding protein CbpA n=1 Tax=Allofustis seminis TaxID=166939 RepID=UPI0003651BB6|nr:cyclic di-AMP binding protein CbpA [Allofustis seminis]
MIKQLAVPKSKVRTVPETITLQEAIDLLEEFGYRCVPVLDESGKIYRGNIYKMHIYRHKANGGDMSLPVTHLLKNATKFIHTNSSFFEIFFMIKDLPYISVLDEEGHFYGILTHGALINLLEQSWKINRGSYVLTIAAPGERGDLTEISRTVNRYSNIMSCITLDLDAEISIKRMIITLEPGITEATVTQLKQDLDKKGYGILSAEKISEN